MNYEEIELEAIEEILDYLNMTKRFIKSITPKLKAIQQDLTLRRDGLMRRDGLILTTEEKNIKPEHLN